VVSSAGWRQGGRLHLLAVVAEELAGLLLNGAHSGFDAALGPAQRQTNNRQWMDHKLDGFGSLMEAGR